MVLGAIASLLFPQVLITPPQSEQVPPILKTPGVTAHPGHTAGCCSVTAAPSTGQQPRLRGLQGPCRSLGRAGCRGHPSQGSRDPGQSKPAGQPPRGLKPAPGSRKEVGVGTDSWAAQTPTGKGALGDAGEVLRPKPRAEQTPGQNPRPFSPPVTMCGGLGKGQEGKEEASRTRKDVLLHHHSHSHVPATDLQGVVNK